MANTLANLARMYTETTGTGTLTLINAVPGFNSFEDAGVADGATITYAIYNGPHREIGAGVWTEATKTLTRGTVYSSTASGAKITLAGKSEVFITPAAEDLASFATDLTAHLNDTADAHDASAISFSATGNISSTDVQAAIAELDSSIREKLTANRTYYVRTDGSDSNTGLTDNASGAFLTIQAAIAAFYLLDLGGYVVTVQVRDGTYTGAVSINSQPPGATATDPLILQGNLAAPANCVISTTSQNAVTVGGNGELLIQGFKLQTTTSGMGIQAIDHSRVYAQSCEFGSCVTAHMEAKDGAEITVANNYTISGGSVCHMHVTSNGYIFYGGGTVTLTGTPAFSSYFIGINNAHAQFGTTTFSGSATGRRYYVHNNASIYTNGTYNASYFPGDVAGILAGGSCIDDFDGTHVLANTGLQIDDTDASHQLTIKPGSNLTADRIFTLTTGDAARTLDISAADVTISSFGAQLIDDAAASNARTTLGLGTAATQNTGTSGATVPLLNASNTFEGYQQINITQDFGSALILQSTQDSANEGPFLRFKRVSASPANNDRVGSFTFTGLNTALAERTLAQFGVYMTDATDASLSSLMVFKTYVSGAFTDRFYIKGALYPSGSADTGATTINAATLYEGGASLASKYGALAGTTAFTAAQTIRIDNAATNSVTVAQTLSHTTTGTPATGIGVALNFEAETAAGNNEVGAQIAAVTTDVTSTSEDFDLVFSAMAAGAAVTERGRITSKGTYKHQSFTVAGLPAGTAGETCFASNGRKNGEGAGLGTGVLVFHDGTNWCACDTGAAVAA